MDMTMETCRKFVEVLASDAPAPGGGGAAALVGAIGTALGNMVGSLTVGKKKYADVQDELKEATAQVVASRLELYEKFPVEMKEEDQIMYVLYLETIFGTEINFAFSKAQPMVALKDGSNLMGLTLTVNYQTTYQGFQDMINYLATDSRVTSVQFANIRYDAARDMAVGTVTLLLYLIDTDLRDYVGPDVNIPDTGKDNIFN